MIELLHELYDKLGDVWSFDITLHYCSQLEDYAYVVLVAEQMDQTKKGHHFALYTEDFDLETFIKTCIETLEGEQNG